MKRRLMILAAGVAAMAAAYSCEEIKNGDGAPEEPYYLGFVHETDALLEFTPDFEGTYEMRLNTNVPAKHLKVYSVDSQDWCSADIREDGGAILITPGTALVQNLEADFVVEVTEYGEDVEPLSFTVRRLFEEIAPSVTVSYAGAGLEEEYPMVAVSGTEQTLTFKVETNASRWKLEYENFSDDEWVSVDKVSGRSGETVTVMLSKNDTGEMRNQTFSFSPAVADADVTVMVTVIQRAWSAIERVVVRKFDANTMTAGEEIADMSQFELENVNTAQTPFCFVVEVVGQGKVEVMFAEPGSSQFEYVAPGEWMFGGGRDIDPEDENAGKYYYITTLANAGEARSADAVLTDSAGVELFRFRFTQKGVSAAR